MVFNENGISVFVVVSNELTFDEGSALLLRCYFYHFIASILIPSNAIVQRFVQRLHFNL